MNEDLKKTWIEEQKKQISLVNPNIVPMNPSEGLFFKVNGLEIPEKFFKEEFDMISKAYFSVIQKIVSHQ